MKNAKMWFLSKSDGIKAFWMFLFSTIVAVVGDAILQMVTTYTWCLECIHWKEIGGAIAVAVITYLKKQLLTGEKGKVFSNEAPAPVDPKNN